jgi:D-alanyl-D-alanine carboxypeptidase/D-alanyl-D-alanine-endopeptidase (penicillin-binding protein 4)
MWKPVLALILAALGALAQPAAQPAAQAAPKSAAQPAKRASHSALARKIESAIAESAVARSAAWGVQATELSSGKTLFELNATHFFVPASNTKLFSTSLALTRLGPDFTFETRVMTATAPDSNGIVNGDLRLVGGGDPNLSGRAIPYRPGPAAGDPLAALADLAAQLAAKGVTRVTGDIVGDDTWYAWEPFGAGWGIDDPLYEYGAPVSALTLNDNAFMLHIRPGANDGDLAALEVSPAVDYYTIDNRVRTTSSGERRIHYSRAPGSMTLELWGTIPLQNKGEDLNLGIDDPARYAALAFRQLLAARGITVGGNAVARHAYPFEAADLKQGAAPMADSGVELARRVSAPLLEDLRVTAKVSQNLHAELDLRAVGKARRNMGSVEAGLEELKAFLTEIGVPATGYNINDGSGLARVNLVSPATIVQLLRFMYASPARANFLSILPVGGQDGTLGSRFGAAEVAGRIHAKTGSLSHVSALSGYAQRKRGDWIAFSILVNNFNGPTSNVRAVMDKICELLAE